MTEFTDWQIVNLKLIAKSLGELSFEEVLSPKLETKDSKSLWQPYILKLSKNITYTFKAWVSVWGYMRVRFESIERQSLDAKPLTAAQFFIDSQKQTEMNDVTLAQFLEEMNSTLYSDLLINKNLKTTNASKIAQMTFTEMQAYLNGHPKILLNKGRMGWSQESIKNYSPESRQKFQLHWVYLKKDQACFKFAETFGESKIYENTLNPKDLARLQKTLSEKGFKLLDYILIPVHPWQWKNILQLHFIDDLQNHRIIDAGVLGDEYQAQISVRTLSNLSDPQKPDLKLPLMILNTSAVRGIPSAYIDTSCEVAQALEDVCFNDEILKSKAVVLKDIAGVSFKSQSYEQILQPPYKYKEMLGAIWRESLESKLKANESGLMTGALMDEDAKGNLILSSLVKASGLDLKSWLKAYFESVFIPLYHLQIKYGIGIVAHGQNIVLRLKNHVPNGLCIKDFQGDVRRSSEHSFKNPRLKALSALPKDYLIHDLFTGHMMTVLRFVSAQLHEKGLLTESQFYNLLSQSLQNYLENQCEGQNLEASDLRRSKFEKVLLNKVRFYFGYQENTERFKPFLGTDMVSPLFQGVQHEKHL